MMQCVNNPTFTCVNRVRNKQNIVTEYILVEIGTNKQVRVKADELRMRLMQNKINVDNLKLSKNCSILMRNTREISNQVLNTVLVQAVLQDFETSYTYRSQLKESGHIFSQAELDSLGRLGGAFVNWGDTKGTIDKCLDELFGLALDEYAEYGCSNKRLKRRVDKIETITNEMRQLESPLNKSILEFTYYIIMKVTNNYDYQHTWRLLFKEMK